MSLELRLRARSPRVGTLRRRPAKRAVDLVLGSVCAMLSLPLVLLLALASAIILRAWPFFLQTRPGHCDTSFTIIKIRSLPRSTAHYSLKSDLDFTKTPRFCQWMRRMHLDELPQLWLVPLGKLSLVGPRPRQSDSVETLDERFDRTRRSVRQGCTGLWQISAFTDGVFTDCPEYDELYVARGTFRLDLWILWRTGLMLVGVGRPVFIEQVPSWLLRRQTTVQDIFPILPPVARAIAGLVEPVDAQPVAANS